MRQAEAKYRARRCMPFGSCKESAWEKEQRGEGGLEEEDYLFRQPGGDSRVPGTFTFRFKKILQEGDLPDNLNVHSLRHTNASMLIAQGVDVRTVEMCIRDRSSTVRFTGWAGRHRGSGMCCCFPTPGETGTGTRGCARRSCCRRSIAPQRLAWTRCRSCLLYTSRCV